ncbi:MAG: glycosyltransferase family 39 protein [Candidatus Zixiibacteriota bacterium]|nr:MAG: glycosyltransferase family 39 protein [candidate division Zixibacteria bacterium]
MIGAALLRALYLNEYQSLLQWDALTVDNYYHHNWARTIADGNFLGDTTYFRAPFYVFCLASVYALVGPSLMAARVFGLIVGLGSIYMTYKLGQRLFDRRIGLIAALVHALYPIALYFEAELLLDSLFTLLLQIAVYKLVDWYENPGAGNLFLVGMWTGLAAITRPTALVLVPVVILIMVLRKKSIRWLGKQCLVLITGLVVFVGPVFVRNLVVGGDAVLIASQGGINFYLGNNSSADGVSAIMPEPLGHNWRLNDITYIAESAAGRELGPGELSSYWWHRGLKWIGENPIDFAKLYLTKLSLLGSNYEFSNNRSLRDFSNKIWLLRINPLSFGLIFPFALLGLGLSWGRNQITRPVTALVIVYSLTIALFIVNARFRLPLVPYVFIMGAAGAKVCFGLFSKGRGTIIAGLAVLLVAGYLSFFPPLTVPANPSGQGQSSVGLFHYNAGNFRQALESYKRARDVDPVFPEVNKNIGACYFRLGQGDSAKFYFELEKQLNPNRIGGFSNLASYHLVNGDYANARAEAAMAVAIKPYDLMANTLLARSAILDRSLSPDSLRLILGDCLRRTRDNIILMNEVASVLSRTAAFGEAERLALQAVSSAYAPIEMDDYAFGALFEEKRAEFVREKAKAYHLLGYLAANKDAFGAAVEYSARAVALDSNMVEAYVNLASGLLSLGHMARSDSVINEALRRFPGHPALSRYNIAR